MSIIATAAVPGSIDQDETLHLPKLPADVADLVARIDAGPLTPLPTCPGWCVEHHEGGIHIGRRHSSAQVFTGHFTKVDGRRVAETETVRVYAESYDGPTPDESEEPGVYLSTFGRLSIEDAMDLAADLLRCASELVAAEIAKARGGSR